MLQPGLHAVQVRLHLQLEPSTVVFQKGDSRLSALVERVSGSLDGKRARQSRKHSRAVLHKVLRRPSRCNYARGSWVRDPQRPLYSPELCASRGLLSVGWACRQAAGRPQEAFDYENWRWQPAECDMPVFDAQRFLKKMRGKLVVFVGDSLGQQMYQSLLCMLSESAGAPEEGELPPGLLDLQKTTRTGKKGYWLYRFPATKTTLLYMWSQFLCDEETLADPEPSVRVHLDRPAPVIQRLLSRASLLVLNTGHHWNRGKLKLRNATMYFGGESVEHWKIDEAKSKAELAILGALDAEMAGMKRKPHVYMRSLSPRHFVGGDWNTGGTCDQDSFRLTGFTVNESRADDPVSREAVAATEHVRHLDITYLSQPRGDAHVSKWSSSPASASGSASAFQDCLHWCLPGVPDVWNELLYADMMRPGESKQLRTTN